MNKYRISIKPRRDLDPDYYMFQIEDTSSFDGIHHIYIMFTRFRMTDSLYVALEDEPSVDGWFLTKRIKNQDNKEQL